MQATLRWHATFAFFAFGRRPSLRIIRNALSSWLTCTLPLLRGFLFVRVPCATALVQSAALETLDKRLPWRAPGDCGARSYAYGVYKGTHIPSGSGSRFCFAHCTELCRFFSARPLRPRSSLPPLLLLASVSASSSASATAEASSLLCFLSPRLCSAHVSDSSRSTVSLVSDLNTCFSCFCLCGSSYYVRISVCLALF